ncbi:hypothetical protein BJ971_003948 [Actinoplanes digitatis]|uniref:Uncharacterized protein n=1 Tax=Actinoplanes digitatis TaxID=1868 RepID=A0A7W7HYZ9_9ACTN|nr:hypothetical protein [Actinoplanes digitatis]
MCLPIATAAVAAAVPGLAGSVAGTIRPASGV